MSLSKVHADSDDSVLSQLDLFAMPHTQTSVLSGDWVETPPVKDSPFGTLEFDVESGGSDYLDLQNTLLHVQCRVKNANGTPIGKEADLKVIPCENFMHSLFSTLSVELNGKQVEYESNYPFRAYLENLINYGSDAKKTHLSNACWFSDNLNGVDTANITAGDGEAVDSRKATIAESKTVDMMGRLHSDLFNQHKYLIPSCGMKIKLRRADPQFCLLKLDAEDASQYVIEIIKCDLLLRKVKVNPSVTTNHNRMLLSDAKIKYSLSKVDTQFFTITQGRMKERVNLSQNRQEPKRILLSFIDHAAVNGSYILSPFNFQHCNLKSIGLTVDGHPVPYKPISTDFENGVYTHAYMQLLMCTGKAFVDEGNCITRQQFAKGCAVFAFDLTGDLCEGTDTHLIKNSSIVLEVEFRQALEKTISLLVYTEEDDLLEIDNSRVIYRTTKSV